MLSPMVGLHGRRGVAPLGVLLLVMSAGCSDDFFPGQSSDASGAEASNDSTDASAGPPSSTAAPPSDSTGPAVPSSTTDSPGSGSTSSPLGTDTGVTTGRPGATGSPATTTEPATDEGTTTTGDDAVTTVPLTFTGSTGEPAGSTGPAVPSGPCCGENDLPSCEEAEVAACVCDLDSFCCDNQWDLQCVEFGETFCGLECPETSSGGGGNCCFPHGGIGCDDPVIEACVCALDPFCCNVAWDGICVNAALFDCGAAC